MSSYTLKVGHPMPSNSKLHYTGEERREDSQRREFSLTTLSHCLTNPRRTQGRRRSDRRFPMLDVFTGAEMFMAVALMLLSLTDALFTLTLLANGGSELNPVMNFFLGYGTFTFVAAKVILTAVPVVLLIACGNHLLFNRVRVRSIVAAAIGCYAGLICYEIGLLSLI